MKTGDTVRVWPHGQEKLATLGKIALISENQRSIAIGFGDAPQFEAGSMMIHPEYGFILLMLRMELNGKPWGPWVELFHDGHYEIEPA